MLSLKTRVAILTSGGDAPGMNAAIASACDCIVREGGSLLGIRGGFAGLAASDAFTVDRNEAHAWSEASGTWLRSSRWPGMHEAAGVARCAQVLRDRDVTGLIVLGGDGSLLAARRLGECFAPIAFVPCTIDGGLEGSSETTIGIDSAVTYALDVIARLRCTAESLPGRSFLVQTLGAPTGHLARAVAAAAGIEDVLVPEQALEQDLERVAASLRQRARQDTAVAVMSEAVGDAVTIAIELARRSGVRVHPTILGHAQRAATPTALDRRLARSAAELAIGQLLAGRSHAISLQDGTAFLGHVLPTPTSASSVLVPQTGDPL